MQKQKNLSRFRTSEESATVTKSSQKKKSPESDGCIGAFYQSFKGEFTSVLLKLFPKIKEERTLQNSFL